MSPNFRSKQDQIAILVAMLSSAGIAIEELMGMSEEKQKEVILSIISKRHPEFSFEGMLSGDQKGGSLDLATALKGILSHAKPANNDTKISTAIMFKPATEKEEDQNPASSYYKNDKGVAEGVIVIGNNKNKSPVKGAQNLPLETSKGGEGGTGSGEPGSGSGGNNKKAIDPRAVMLENLKKRQLAGSTARLQQQSDKGLPGLLPEGLASPTATLGRSHSSFTLNTLTINKGSVESTKAKDIPELADLFQQIKGGAPRSALVEKVMTQGLVDSSDLANSLLSLDPDKPLPPDFKQKFNILISLASHPKYEKFYKMLKVGISKDIVKAKMQDNGLDPTVIDKDPDSTVPLNPNMSFFASKSRSGDDVFISVEEQHKYAKYVKMSQMGMASDVIRKKMVEEGLDPSNLQRLPPLREGSGGGYGPGLGPGLGPGGGLGHSSSKSNLKSASGEKIAIADHPKYAKYFKMLKIGLDREAVKAKMSLEGIDPAMLDRDPSDLIPLNEGAVEEKPKVALKDHPKYAKFFQMLKVGVPAEVVKGKMSLEGLDSAIIERDPSELVPLNDEEDDGPKVPVSEHPVYSKFFKMLKVGLPIHVIKAKMEAEGANPDMIDKDPSELVPLEEKKAEVAKVPASEHPVYAKFFKMLKLGVPLEIIKAKMALEKADPSVIERDPGELIPLEDDKDKDKEEKKGGIAGALGGLFGGKKQQQKQRKKKLYWKAIDASQVNENSLWAERTDDDLNIFFDEDEFNQLFVEPTAEESTAGNANKAGSGKAAKPKKEAKKTRVVLIDMKRAQNGGIALARIRFDFDEVKRKVMNMDDDHLTTDQLKSLIEYLPSNEESLSLKNYNGPLDVVGVAERYMMTVLGFSTAEKRIQCMIYKQQFRGRYLECRTKITKIQNACDDVKLSARLKKVLKYILKVGNQLNDGEEHKGFTVDSLLKLQSAKAYDKKTTVLQYVITLIYRNDEDCLKFPEDLKHVTDAARLAFDVVLSEKNALRQEFSTNLNIVEEIRNSDPESDTDAMLDFLTKADQQCTELERGFDKAKEKFSGVLVYFGEDPNMSSQDFFSTLFKFIQEFITVREAVVRMKRLEMKRQQQQQQQSNPTPRPSRRATTTVVRSDSAEREEREARRSGSAERRPVGDEREEETEPTDNSGAETARPAFLSDISNMAKKSSRRRSNFI